MTKAKDAKREEVDSEIGEITVEMQEKKERFLAKKAAREAAESAKTERVKLKQQLLLDMIDRLMETVKASD